MTNNMVFFIVGATASGKSKLAIKAAQKYGGEIVNADSIQNYISLNIGSAKPPLEERKLVPHHLVDFIEDGDVYTAGRFHRDAIRVLTERFDAGVKKIYVVGGSGFYIQALLKGLYPIPQILEETKTQIRAQDPKNLFKQLQEVDPDYSGSINANDTYRIQRAMEVYLQTGVPFSNYKKSFEKSVFPFSYKLIGLKTPKENLVKRITARALQMLEMGLVDETKDLLQKGLKNWLPLSSVGYKETTQFLEGDLRHEDLLSEIIKSTTGLAKRQLTWFKRDKEIEWFDIESEWEQALSSMEKNHV